MNRRFCISLIIIFFSIVVRGKTFYLDGELTGDCDGNYSIENRDNSGSDGDAYNNIQHAMDVLSGGDTLIIREGNYSRTGFDPRNPPEIGALDIGWGNSCDGTSSEHTVVMAYPGEQPVILAEPGKDHYNPDPGDITYTNSSRYYNNPAVGIHGEYIDVHGLKTYGQVVITYASNILLEGCDLGGGGPHCDQGNVIVLNYWSHDVVIRNNRVHNSCWGENNDNGAAIICYHASATIENNEFYDNWGADIYIKDTGEQEGRIIEVRYNFFRPSSIYPNCVGYVCHNQAMDIDTVYVHHNIFFSKAAGVQWGTVDVPDMPVFPYNNTFVNCTDMDLHAWGTTHRLISYNNLFYHDNGVKHYYVAYNVESANYNLFHSTTNEADWKLEGVITTDVLLEWQDSTGQDLNSANKDPLFVNANGNRPEDFKRQDYSGDVTGSPYSTICGAYETGDEIIGLVPGDSSYVKENGKPLLKLSLEQYRTKPLIFNIIIKYYLPVNGRVSLKIFDLLGRDVATLVNRRQPAGEYEAEFDGCGLSSGVYFCRLDVRVPGYAKDLSAVRKLILVR